MKISELWMWCEIGAKWRDWCGELCTNLVARMKPVFPGQVCSDVGAGSTAGRIGVPGTHL